jgi:hypothetical protein
LNRAFVRFGIVLRFPRRHPLLFSECSPHRIKMASIRPQCYDGDERGRRNIRAGQDRKRAKFVFTQAQ